MGDSDFSQCKLLGSSRENGNCAAPSKPSKPPIGGLGRNYINPFVHEVEVTNPLTKLKVSHCGPPGVHFHATFSNLNCTHGSLEVLQNY